MKYKGIIFDLDGTLVNSVEDIADAMNKVLSTSNYPTHSYSTYLYFIGNGLRTLVQRALPLDRRSDAEIDCHFIKMIDCYRAICTQKTKPYNGIIMLLDELKKRDIKMAVFSNKADELTKKVVTELFPDYFSHVIGLTTEPLKKPNPQVGLSISKDWNFTPDEVLFIGDSDVDMLTAKNANMKAVAVGWGYRTSDELQAAGAEIFINNANEILQLFN